MQGFISNIVQFIKDIYNSIVIALENKSISGFNTFVSKNVFTDNSLIGFNLTWYELIYFIGTFLLIILFLYLIIKLFCSLLKIFEL